MTGNSYWAPLSDALPSDVLNAMGKAVLDATHHDKGRDGEPMVLAGVRGLLDLVILKADHDAQVQQLVHRQRAEYEAHQRELTALHDRVRGEVRVDLERLEAARVLAFTNRKTVSVADLRVALGIDEPAPTTGAPA